MKILLENSNIKVVLYSLELDQLLQGNTLKGKCQLSEEDNLLSWSVEARFMSGVPDLSFKDAHLSIRLPKVELSNLLEDATDCICHVLHPSKHELHLCIEKVSNGFATADHILQEGHPSAIRKT